ncbi:MAG: hypothetical protein IT307_02290 [Chloroflexi bacterium]|nr:hypothetical protein [Chloroflexota bacterium]
MTDTLVERRIRLSAERAERMRRLAQAGRVSEDEIIERALDILFHVTELVDAQAERQAWSFASEEALARVWDNDEDARYDNWREIHDVPTG